MLTPLQIVIADDDKLLLDTLTSHIEEIGHQVVAAVETGEALVAACEEHCPSLVIADIVLPDMSGLEAVSRIQQIRTTPVLIISAYDDPEYIQHAKRDNVMCYLVKPVTKENLKANIELSLHRAAELMRLKEEAMSLQQRLSDRKAVERAKGILMARTGLTEPEAHRRLQELASTKHRKLSEIARLIIDADEVLGPE